MTTRAVFDSSALLALLRREPGAAEVAANLHDGSASSLIACDVQTRLIRKDMPPREARAAFENLRLEIFPFTPQDAAEAAALWPHAVRAGLSLADRACLVLARTLSRPVYTADRPWMTLDVPIDIRMIR